MLTRNKTRVNQVNGPLVYALNLIFIQTLKYIKNPDNLIDLGWEGGVGLCSCLGALRLCMTPWHKWGRIAPCCHRILTLCPDGHPVGRCRKPRLRCEASKCIDQQGHHCCWFCLRKKQRNTAITFGKNNTLILTARLTNWINEGMLLHAVVYAKLRAKKHVFIGNPFWDK